MSSTGEKCPFCRNPLMPAQSCQCGAGSLPSQKSDSGRDGLAILPKHFIFALFACLVVRAVFLHPSRFLPESCNHLLGCRGLVASASLVWFVVSSRKMFAMYASENGHPDFQQRTKRLLTEADFPFNLARNPFYLALVPGLFTFLAFAFDDLLAYAAVLPFYAFLNFYIIPHEESALKRDFGDEYVKYVSRVKRWGLV